MALSKKIGSAQRAGCASSRLATPPRRARVERRRQDSSNGYFAESGLTPTRLTEAKDEHDASHVQTPPTSKQEPSP
jgi:hypothetical protein